MGSLLCSTSRVVSAYTHENRQRFGFVQCALFVVRCSFDPPRHALGPRRVCGLCRTSHFRVRFAYVRGEDGLWLSRLTAVYDLVRHRRSLNRKGRFYFSFRFCVCFYFSLVLLSRCVAARNCSRPWSGPRFTFRQESVSVVQHEVPTARSSTPLRSCSSLSTRPASSCSSSSTCCSC